MSAVGLPGGMQRAIAAIIDPEAFAAGADEKVETIISRRRDALRKAGQIASMDFLLEDLPRDLQGAAALLDELITPPPLAGDVDELIGAVAEAYPDFALYPDRPVHGAFVKPLGDGSLVVVAMVPKRTDPAGLPAFIGARFEDDRARRVCAEIDVAADGGGRA